MNKASKRQAMRIGGWAVWLCLGGLIAAGCATSNQEPKFSELPGITVAATNTGPATPTNSEPRGLTTLTQTGDRFAIGDQVTVKFSGISEQLSPHEERIKEDGTITLPLIGAVKSVGKTAGELQTEIHNRYVPDYYRRLTVTVTGEQRVYSVGGRVRSPGRQVYIGATTVLKAIQSAGDFDDFAAKTRVEVTRANGAFIVVDCEKAAKNPKLDLPIYPGDKINVPLRDWRDIFR